MRGAIRAGVAALILGAGPAAARLAAQQRVTLRIHPPVGDTLRMQLQQQFDMTTDNAPGTAPMAMSGVLLVWTHAAVLARHGGLTELESVTDSVRVDPPAAAALPPLRDAKRALEGKTVQLRVSEDGRIDVGQPRAGTSAFTMQSVLPPGPVAVGGTWARELRVPLSTTRGASALVRTTFRLDSLGDDGAVAYVSLRGDVWHDHADDPGGLSGRTTGTLTGTLRVDRRLAWITGSQMIVALTSTVTHAGKPPTRVHVRVTQTLRALPGD